MNIVVGHTNQYSSSSFIVALRILKTVNTDVQNPSTIKTPNIQAGIVL